MLLAVAKDAASAARNNEEITGDSAVSMGMVVDFLRRARDRLDYEAVKSLNEVEEIIGKEAMQKYRSTSSFMLPIMPSPQIIVPFASMLLQYKPPHPSLLNEIQAKAVTAAVMRHF